MHEEGRGRPARMIALAALVTGTLWSVPASLPAQIPASEIEARVWLGRGEAPVVHRGDRIRLYYRTSRDAYVSVFHLDTDGTVRLLHPRAPGEDHYTRGRRDYRLLFPRSSHWQVDEDPGVGYFFLVASDRPLDFSSFRFSGRIGGWDLSVVGRRVYRDPFVAMDDFLAHLLPGPSRVYALDYVEYHVGRRHRYPRFVCYDCHTFRPFFSWNPYHYQCRSFRIVIFTDPYFYPVYRYRGTRVVYQRPPALPYGRFAFKERASGEPATPIYRTSREADLSGLRLPERRREAGPGRVERGTDAPAVRPDAASRGTRPPARDGGATRTRPPAGGTPDADRDIPVRDRGGAERVPVPLVPQERGPDGARVAPRGAAGRDDVPDRPVLERRPERGTPAEDVRSAPGPIGRDRGDASTSPAAPPRVRRGDEPAPERRESTSPSTRRERPERTPPPRSDGRPDGNDGRSSPSATPAPRGDRSEPSARPAPRGDRSSTPARPAPRPDRERPAPSAGSSDRRRPSPAPSDRRRPPR